MQLENGCIQAAIYRAGRFSAKHIPVIFKKHEVDEHEGNRESNTMPDILFNLGYIELDGRNWGKFDELHFRLTGTPQVALPAQPPEIVPPDPQDEADGAPPG